MGGVISGKKHPAAPTRLPPGDGPASWLRPIVVALCIGLLAIPALGRKKHDADPVPGEALLISSDLRVAVRQGRDVELQVRAVAGDDYASIALRVTSGEENAAALKVWNGSSRVKRDRWIRVPLALLSAEFRALSLRNLFPEDGHDGDDWVHLARSGALPTYDEGLWQVAQWFTGRGESFSELMRVNGLSSPELREDQRIRIPGELLHPAFQARLRSDRGALEYGSDASGPYAAYRLKPGDALYSSVVVRFTGRTGDEDVRALADELARRSGITDPRDIPVGYEVKIPLELLEPEFLPAGHPRRSEAEARLAELDRELARQPVAGARGLKGVVVVLDPGHGGRDLGTMNNGIWEHDYVYDVSCRIRRILERETAATVVMTLEDLETGCAPSSSDKLVANHQGTVLTTPTFLAREEGEARIGVNLRWYLANSVYREALEDGVSRDRVVFLSLHADSRHPGLRGLMVYVPGAAYRTKTYGSTSKTYRKYEEVREKPTISFSSKQRVRSEAVSRELAAAIVDSFEREGLPIQPHKPVRDKVIRGRAKWVPAVLRGNAVPTKVLVEMVNLSNREDAALLGQARERERIARSIANSLFLHFGESPPSVAATTAAP